LNSAEFRNSSFKLLKIEKIIQIAFLFLMASPVLETDELTLDLSEFNFNV
jgi:hypothetical protein